MRSKRNYLFCTGKLRENLNGKRENAVAEINGLPENQILGGSETDVIDWLVEKYDVAPIRLRIDEIYKREPEEALVDVSNDRRHSSEPGALLPGVTVSIVIPFDGDPALLNLQPQFSAMSPPMADLIGEEIVWRHTGVRPTAQEIQAEFQQTLQLIERLLTSTNSEVEQYRRDLRPSLTNTFENRRKRLLANRGLVDSLKMPLKRKEGAASYPVPMIRRKLMVTAPAKATTAFTPEPLLANEEYAFIVDTIQKMSLVMEKSPHVFAQLGEEDIRTHFLLPLNAAYEATAETFNYEGKTDILIRCDGKNIFIAECALWKGDEYLTQKINQLLGYTSWRDTKTAILLFSRNKDFSSVLDKIPGIVTAHPNCKKELARPGETQFRYLFHQRDDRNREMVVTVLAFNVPKL